MTRIDAVMIPSTTIAPPHSAVLPSAFFHIEEEVHVKVDAKKDHKHGNYALQVGGIASKLSFLIPKPPVPRGAENGTQGIKHRHLSYKQENNL